MKWLKRILGAVALVLLLGVVTLAVAISYDADCEAPPSPTGSDTMQAVVHTCYGGPDVLVLAALDKPVPADGQVLVRVHAAAVNPLDWHYMRGAPYIMRLMSGIGKPSEIRLGVDYAGTVEAVGNGVTRFKVGDAVFGGHTGAFAEYLVTGEDSAIAHKPDNVGFAEAAAVPIAGVTALQALRDSGAVAAGDKVLVNGASGGVGPFAVQLGKYFGAEVTGVASDRNRDLVLSLGADRFIDYRTTDYTEEDVRYDLIVDNVGNQPLLDNADVLQPDGVLVMVGGPPGNWIGPLVRPLSALVLNPFSEPAFKPFLAGLSSQDLAFLAERMAAGDVTPVVDREFGLDELADAIHYSEEGHARAKIVIRILGEAGPDGG